MSVSSTQLLSKRLRAAKGDIPLITGFPAFFAIVSDHCTFTLSAFKRMSLAINVNHYYRLAGTIAVTDKELGIDRIKWADMPFRKSVEVLMSG